MLLCFLCKNEFGIDRLEEDILTVHFSHSICDEYKCPESSCCRSYSTFKAFKRHWLLKHDCNPLKNDNSNRDSFYNTKSEYVNVETNPTYSTNSNQNSHNLKIFENLQETIFNKTIELYNSPAISLKHVQTFVTHTKEIVASTIRIINEELKVTEDDSASVSNARKLLDAFDHAFDNVDTEHKRIAILEQNGYYIPRIKVLIGRRFQDVKRSLEGKIKSNTKAYAYFFLLRDILKKIFELPGVYDAVFE